VAPLTYRVFERTTAKASQPRDAGPTGRTFGCHGEIKKDPKERGVCVGWLLDQRERDVPSIMLRMQLNQSEELREQFEKSRPPRGVKLYESIAEMCEANYPGGRDRPRPMKRRAKRKTK